MDEKKDLLSRRSLLQGAGMAGLGSLLSPFRKAAAASETGNPDRVPTRPFGKTGFDVSILALGGMFDIVSNQLVLRQALRWGVTYWDTADCYGGGRSEEGIGKFFSRAPEARKQVFLVTKSDARDPSGMTRLLERSIQRLQTDTIDLYCLHAVNDIGELNEDVRRWVDHEKNKGRIRLFGFSTHRNMEECLLGAAKLGWVDGIMFSYNFRLMHRDAMKRAVDACAEKGIGLTAMKTQGGGPVHVDSDLELELAGRFLKKGFTDKQAKLKAVWEDPRIASVCSQMPNLTILAANVAAALDRTRLSDSDRILLQRYAEETAGGYCAGCARICETAAGGDVPIADLMRSLMYGRCYGDAELRRFALRHHHVAAKKHEWLRADLERAEAVCPSRLPIRKLLASDIAFHTSHTDPLG